MIAGVDEAGRGPLAGPVVAAAVILPPDCALEGLNDSKVLSHATRERLEIEIKQAAVAWAVAYATVDEIDKLNILWATMEAMRRAVDMLKLCPSKALVDGNRIPPSLRCAAEAIVDGDALVPCISAASILAKTERDRCMRDYAALYPEYGFDHHFGYATAEHYRALEAHGPCPIHRRSFRLGDPQMTLEFV